MITEDIITSYKGYKNTDYNNICIAMCFFNPVNYKSNLENIKTVISELKKTNIPFFIIELVYPGQSSAIPNPTCVVKGKSFYFAKENLWNILETKIPDKYEKIMFLDADVLCTDPEWINKTAELLNTNKVVHASDYLYKDIYRDNIYEIVTIDAIKGRHTIVKAIKTNASIDYSLYHPGFNICIRRNFFHQIGGFFDTAPITIGDTLFWLSFVPNYKGYCGTFFSAPNFKEQKIKYIEYRNTMISYCDPNTEIDYLPNNHCLHLYHGKIKHRYYGKQFNFIPGPFTFYKNEDSVIEIEIKHPFVKDLKQYFESRREDDMQ
jgi:hypothetical protein